MLFVGSHTSDVYEDANGNRFWVPRVKKEVKPVPGRCYHTFDDVVEMYKVYAKAAGFAVRIGGYKKWKNVITHRMVMCNKAGICRSKKIDTTDPLFMDEERVKTTKSTNCKAVLKVKAVMRSTNFLIYSFIEKHNHGMVSSENMDLLRTGRDLSVNDVQFIHSMSVNGIGPTVAHRLKSSLVGGHQNMSGTKNAYRNFSRDVRMYIGDRDVQMVSNQLEQRRINHPNFSYEILHDQGKLKCIFWADNISKINYQSFGDVIAFDATYATNM